MRPDYLHFVWGWQVSLTKTFSAKRGLDILISAVALVCLSPIMIGVSLAILWLMGPPVIFRQDRLGKGGAVFQIFKFRTMVHRERSIHEDILGDHPEVPPLGRALRRFKIDELPQFWNVLKGDMSIVGPRPALPCHLAEYDAVSVRRLDVRPGLTGLAQISGNTRLNWPQRWALDVHYVESQSFWLDIEIILKTLRVILLGERRFHRGG